MAKFDAYPMPRMEEMFESIGSATVVSTLDLASGYWQIPLAPGSREKTAFATPFGLFVFEVMPFGLHNAPAIFQRMMDHVLRDCQDFARAYINNIAVFSHSWEEYLSHLQQFFNRLQLAGLTVKLKKCRFGGQEVSYLGHVIGGGRLLADPTKLQAVRDYPRPVTKRDVRAFLGLVGYYRRFIPHFATVAAPLTDLTCKCRLQHVTWNAETEIAFQKLKDLLVETPVLGVADPSRSYVLQCDASERGLGAVLSQADRQGDEHPIAYASRKLLPRETKYSTIEKNVWPSALKFFHIYLYGQSFVIQTDHQPLAWLQRMKNSNSRLTRWALAVQPYCLTLVHRKGADNGNADGLSHGTQDMNDDSPDPPKNS